MKMLQPYQINYETGLLATNVAQETFPEYDEYTQYFTGDKVVVLDSYQRVYEALADVIGVFPPEMGDSNQVTWLDLGPTNRYGMFDGQGGTETRQATLIDVTIQPPSPVDTVGFFGLHADELRVKVLSPFGDTLYDQTFDLHLPALNPLESVQRVSDRAVYNLPAVEGMRIQAQISVTSGDVACGLMLPSIAKSIGTTQVGSSVGIIDFSKKELDEFGRPFIVKRRYSKRGTFNLSIPNNLVDAVHKSLSGYRAEPVGWVGSDDLQSTMIYGWYRDFDIVIQGPTVSTCSLSVEGLI